ncbi:hypothetical protein DFJ74DRAFT_429505 [Hyaloraphidium curvatum]|nr:hypothetical protein DFJ74DRAFT_429505 [Hyaloraphidium curvatum]
MLTRGRPNKGRESRPPQPLQSEPVSSQTAAKALSKMDGAATAVVCAPAAVVSAPTAVVSAPKAGEAALAAFHAWAAAVSRLETTLALARAAREDYERNMVEYRATLAQLGEATSAEAKRNRAERAQMIGGLVAVGAADLKGKGPEAVGERCRRHLGEMEAATGRGGEEAERAREARQVLDEEYRKLEEMIGGLGTKLAKAKEEAGFAKRVSIVPDLEKYTRNLRGSGSVETLRNDSVADLGPAADAALPGKQLVTETVAKWENVSADEAAARIHAKSCRNPTCGCQGAFADAVDGSAAEGRGAEGAAC